MLLIATSINTKAQTDSAAEKFRPYVSAGAGISLGTPTYGIEAGCWNNRMWYAVVAEFTPVDKSISDTLRLTHPTTHQLYFGPKIYYRYMTQQKVDFFMYGAAKVGLNDPAMPIVLEPGTAFVYNITKHAALQWSISLPFTNTTSQPIVSSGLCFNWFF